MFAFDALAAPQVSGCPRCSMPFSTLSLLTSMTRYYVCPHCDCRWQVSRVEAREQHPRSWGALRAVAATE
jgi:DNA-directed RNA polymerase subunit RPC12/RpoP